MNFRYINVKTKEKNNFFFKSEKNSQTQLMSFCYINIETKMKKKLFFSKLQKCRSLQKCKKKMYMLQVLLHFCRCRNNRKKNYFFLKYENIYRSRKYLQVSVT